MKIYRTGPRFFEIPHATVFLLVTANVVIYGLCLLYSGLGTTAKFGATSIPTNVLFAAGAMYSSAIAKHEYWRLAAYGFLHADLLHLTTNMFCLALWGAHLERRVGSFYFIVIYVCALIFGAIVSDATHAGPFLMVGASGAISGVLGALFCLWILAKIDLTPNFFVVNIGLNVALALYASSIDWGAHLGGFVAGLIACAVLDLIEKANAHIFRCKFPEFAKLNSLGLLGALALLVFAGKSIPTSAPETWLAPLVYGLACFAGLKLLDILLSIKKGLAAAVIIFAAANGALVFFYFRLLAINCASHNLPYTLSANAMIDFACANKLLTLTILALCASLLTVVLYLPWFYRGIKDVGFIGASFRAERKRQHGI
jgi:membrane associated rhomboid family serine protease